MENNASKTIRELINEECILGSFDLVSLKVQLNLGHYIMNTDSVCSTVTECPPESHSGSKTLDIKLCDKQSTALEFGQFRLPHFFCVFPKRHNNTLQN